MNGYDPPILPGITQIGTGQVTVGAAAGVVLRSLNGLYSTAGQYATIGLRHRTGGEWVLSGSLA
jgi:hypothetical protein